MEALAHTTIPAANSHDPIDNLRIFLVMETPLAYLWRFGPVDGQEADFGKQS
jgi:hypothetical protein